MEHSVLERQHRARAEQAYGLCLGRITNVYPKERMVEVKTFAGAGSLNAQHIAKCQWLNLDSDPDGDEATSIPRRGSIGMVAFIDGEPYVIGYFKGLRKNGEKYDATTGKEPYTLSVGDKVIATKNGSRITVKANGVIEIISKETLKTVYFPNESQLVNLCRYYELKTDGGYVKWGTGKDIPGQTKFEGVYRMDVAGSMAVIETKGAAGGTTILRTVVAPGLTPEAALYKHEVDIDGTSRRIIGPAVPTYEETIGPDGSIEIKAASGFKMSSILGDYTIDLDVGSYKTTAKVGDITLEATAGHIEVHSLQDTALLSDAGNVDIEATVGDVMLNGSQAKMKLSKGMVAIGGPAAELLDLFSQMLVEFSNLLTALQAETHVGNMGYPTSPPTNVSAYVQVLSKVTQILGLLSSIKGSL